MDENQDEAVEAPKTGEYRLLKFGIGLLVGTIMGKVVDKGVDAFMARRNNTNDEETE